MKKIFAIIFMICFSAFNIFSQGINHLHAGRKYESEGKFIHALGEYFDGQLTNDSNSITCNIEYKRLSDFISEGTFGKRKNHIFEIHDIWTSILLEFENYWSAESPWEISVNYLKLDKINYSNRTYTYKTDITYKQTDKYEKNV
ncbi:MAG: hypothetical protein MJ174_07995 [Treponema sp.]|nr:hypothetical protein [Treponema sp.]